MSEKNGNVTFGWIAGILVTIILAVAGALYAGHDQRIRTAENQISINTSRLSALEEFSKSSRDDRAQLRSEVATLRKELNDKMDYVIRLQLEAKKK